MWIGGGDCPDHLLSITTTYSTPCCWRRSPLESSKLSRHVRGTEPACAGLIPASHSTVDFGSSLFGSRIDRTSVPAGPDNARTRLLTGSSPGFVIVPSNLMNSPSRPVGVRRSTSKSVPDAGCASSGLAWSSISAGRFALGGSGCSRRIASEAAVRISACLAVVCSSASLGIEEDAPASASERIALTRISTFGSSSIDSRCDATDGSASRPSATTAW